MCNWLAYIRGLVAELESYALRLGRRPVGKEAGCCLNIKMLSYPYVIDKTVLRMSYL